MTGRQMLSCLLLAACGADPADPPAVDGSPDAPAARSCRTFGPFAPGQRIARAGGGPVAASGVESDPSVIREGGKLRMWFTTANTTPPANLRTAYAESDDGLTWTAIRDAVIEPSLGTFDGNGVETVSVVRGGDATYRLFYTGDEPPEGSDRFAIGVATSPDGLAIRKRPAPLLPPALPWEQPFCEDEGCTRRVGGTLEPSVIFDGTTYRMWYAALGAIGDRPSFRIGHATSPDGETWTRQPEPVFEAAPFGAWDEVLVSHPNVVADPGGGYHLFYFGSSIADHERCDAEGGCLLTPGGIGHAFSPDGITWTRNPANPIVAPSAGFGAWSVGGPSALIEDGVLKLWYFGTPAAHSLDLRMGFTSAACAD